MAANKGIDLENKKIKEGTYIVNKNPHVRISLKYKDGKHELDVRVRKSIKLNKKFKDLLQTITAIEDVSCGIVSDVREQSSELIKQIVAR